MARRKVAKSYPKTKNCRTTKRKTCARTKKPKKEGKLKKIGKFMLGAGALAGAGALGYYGYKHRNELGDMYNAAKGKLGDYYEAGKGKIEDMYNSAKTNYYDPAVEKMGDYYESGKEKLGNYYNSLMNSDLVQTSKIRANDWADAGRTQVRHLKDAAYGYMTNFADKIAADNGEGYINTARNATSKYINEFAKRLKQYKRTDLVPYQHSDVDTMLNNFKNSVKTSNNFDPNQYMNIAANYLNDVQNRDPFKANDIIPDFVQGLQYLLGANKTLNNGETYFADTYKKGLENVLDTLIGKHHRLME